LKDLEKLRVKNHRRRPLNNAPQAKFEGLGWADKQVGLCQGESER